MKKFKFICLFLIMFCPVFVKAYGIENYYIDASLTKTGDLVVQEYFNLNGEFNGFERKIYYKNSSLYDFDPNTTSFGGSSIHNGDGLEINEVRGLSIDSNFDFSNIDGDIFKSVSSASKGKYGVYTVDTLSYGKDILIYNPSKRNKAFYIKYTIKNLAIKHNDVGEIGWNVVGDSLTESVDNIVITLHLPSNSDVRAWAHGPLNGNIEIINPATVKFTLQGLDSYCAVDIRATFDLDVIVNSTKTTNTDALDKIIKYETDKAEQANYEREQYENRKISEANEYLNSFEKYLTRSGYELAKNSIYMITDEDIRSEYLDRLTYLKEKLDEKEEEEARTYLKYARDLKTYDSYIELKEKIDILDNVDVKKELLVNLEEVKKMVMDSEDSLEEKNYIIGITLAIIIILIGLYTYYKYIRDPKVDFNYTYYRDIDDDYIPTTVSYLMYKKINNKAISASMLDLIRLKVITASKLSKNNYLLTLNNDAADKITPVYEKLIKMIFNGKNSIETKCIKKQAKKNYDSYISTWDSYQKMSLNIAKSNKFYEQDGQVKSKNKRKASDISSIVYIFIILFVIIPGLAFFLLFIYLMYLIIFKGFKAIINRLTKIKDYKKSFIKITYLIACIISIYKMIFIRVMQGFYYSSIWLYLGILVISIFLFVWLLCSSKRTEFGALKYKKWRAIKRFLNDFGSFKDKDTIEVALWEKYLVFATLFGCAKKVADAMKLEQVSDPAIPSDIYYDIRLADCLASSVYASYAQAQSAYAAAHSDNYSSGSGSGGGFSSGGGSFGGGGGGGRF